MLGKLFNADPVVTITGPADGSEFAPGGIVTFTATVSDTEEGDLSTGLAWESSIDGAIGMSGTLAFPLSLGFHTITATVADTGILGFAVPGAPGMTGLPKTGMASISVAVLTSTYLPVILR